MHPPSPIVPGAYPAQLVLVMEDALVAISELSRRISASCVRAGWRRRAAWSGYARALQLQGGEIDEIDVFSWGAGVPLPARPRRHTHDDEFGAFAGWWRALETSKGPAWRDALPFTPQLERTSPRLMQALDLTRQYALRSGTLDPWLALPGFLHALGLTSCPLPCLVAGAKAFRMRPPVPDESVRATLRGLAEAARRGLETLEAMEAAYRASVLAIQAEYRPGALPRLLALNLQRALLSPSRVAADLELSLAGAGKLLDRAADLGILVEISGRRAWKAYMAPDLAVRFGFQRPAQGRPRKPPVFDSDRAELAGVLSAFDREMAEIDRRLAGLGVPA